MLSLSPIARQSLFRAGIASFLACYHKTQLGGRLKRFSDPVLAATTLGHGVQSTDTHNKRCPRCGGELEFKTTCENPTTGSPVDFFKCKDCGHVHTVKR